MPVADDMTFDWWQDLLRRDARLRSSTSEDALNAPYPADNLTTGSPDMSWYQGMLRRDARKARPGSNVLDAPYPEDENIPMDSPGDWYQDMLRRDALKARPGDDVLDAPYPSPKGPVKKPTKRKKGDPPASDARDGKEHEYAPFLPNPHPDVDPRPKITPGPNPPRIPEGTFPLFNPYNADSQRASTFDVPAYVPPEGAGQATAQVVTPPETATKEGTQTTTDLTTPQGILSGLDAYLEEFRKRFPEYPTNNPAQDKADAFAARELERTKLIAQLYFAGKLTEAGGWGDLFSKSARAYEDGFDRYREALRRGADRAQGIAVAQYNRERGILESGFGAYNAAVKQQEERLERMREDRKERMKAAKDRFDVSKEAAIDEKTGAVDPNKMDVAARSFYKSAMELGYIDKDDPIFKHDFRKKT